MNIKTIIISSVAGVALTGLSAAALVLARPVTELPVQSITDLPSAPAFAVEDSKAPHEYWLKELDGYVAVYTSEKRDVPFEVTDIAVATLRLADQDMFRRGVLVSGAEGLVTFLEDFGP